MGVFFPVMQVFEASLQTDKLGLCMDYIDGHGIRGETISNTLFVHFYSDSEESGFGFELSYAHTEGKSSM